MEINIINEITAYHYIEYQQYTEEMSTLSLIQYKEIVKVVDEAYGLDLHAFAHHSMKRNFLRLMDKFHFRSPELFTVALKSNKRYFDSLLAGLYNEHIYLFRDPSFWRLLPGVLRNISRSEELKIWVPELGGAEELYSLLIVLQEHDLLNNAHIFATDSCRKNLDMARSGKVDAGKLHESRVNYRRYAPDRRLEQHMLSGVMSKQMDSRLLKKVIFKQGWVMDVKLPYKANFVLFRNRLLFYNHVLAVKVMHAISRQVKGGGLLSLGIGENPELLNVETYFKMYDPKENIYKRVF